MGSVQPLNKFNLCWPTNSVLNQNFGVNKSSSFAHVLQPWFYTTLLFYTTFHQNKVVIHQEPNIQFRRYIRHHRCGIFHLKITEPFNYSALDYGSESSEFNTLRFWMGLSDIWWTGNVLVTAHVPNFDFLTGCREFKRCAESKRTFENRLHRAWLSSIRAKTSSKLHWSMPDKLSLLSFVLGETRSL